MLYVKRIMKTIEMQGWGNRLGGTGRRTVITLRPPQAGDEELCFPILAGRHGVCFAREVCGLKAADYAHRTRPWRGAVGLQSALRALMLEHDQERFVALFRKIMLNFSGALDFTFSQGIRDKRVANAKSAPLVRQKKVKECSSIGIQGCENIFGSESGHT